LTNKILCVTSQEGRIGKKKEGLVATKGNIVGRFIKRQRNMNLVKGKETGTSWPRISRPLPARVKISCRISSSMRTNQSCSPTRPARPLGKLNRLVRSATPNPRCCSSCPLTAPGNTSRAPDSMLAVAGRLVYSGPRV